ncbi:hypothetical protein CEXT_629101 [Caerostris extrusa]|uniref:Uncharacterized protein n=1 Tax=Caerostris extrusa TaxID=172846 RepID=A0AAV4W4J0_CAEEX|nr:hypothetical protein CEXT_629101 [Caerostris extrusa]
MLLTWVYSPRCGCRVVKGQDHIQIGIICQIPRVSLLNTWMKKLSCFYADGEVFRHTRPPYLISSPRWCDGLTLPRRQLKGNALKALSQAR